MRTKIRLALAGLATLVLAACSSIPSATDIPANIANATTATDHLRIADYFAQKAQAYDADALSHRKMAISYIGRSNKVELASMRSHCQALESQLISAAKEVRALEQAHRQLAAGIGQ